MADSFFHLTRLLLLTLACLALPLQAASGKVSISLQDVEIQDVMKMLSKQQRVNIFVSDGVEGKISINLYDMDVTDAIRAISEAAGYAVEQRNGSYFLVERDEVGKYNQSGMTQVRSFKVQYTNPAQVEGILKEHLSSYGKITTLIQRGLLIVEDKPAYLEQIEFLLNEIDREPKQILIEAKILEVTLTDGESFGLDWTKFFTHNDGDGSFGIQNLANPGSPGLFFQFISPDIEIALDALKTSGRLHTLSTPKLLAMEDRTAETVVGTQLGYRVTTTINQVTSESIEFLETGIILKVIPSVDRQGRILLEIHPEVSDGVVSDDGIPSKSTTQLSTRMLVPDGQTVFLGGLIRRNTNESREGVPVLGDLPGVGKLFSNSSKRVAATEIVVLITPKVVNFSRQEEWNTQKIEKIERIDQRLRAEEERVEQRVIRLMDGESSSFKTLEDAPPATEDNFWMLDL